ncbi:MAG: hypothetical protein ABJ013_08170 [Halioglobus sp.]
MLEPNILPFPRQHRKGIKAPLIWRELPKNVRFTPKNISDLNSWIGIIFAMGAGLFAAGCLGALCPAYMPQFLATEANVNLTFFAGSIPFTIAALLQLIQAELAGDYLDGGEAKHNDAYNWRFRDRGWRACAYQFVGTLAFNLNTFDAMTLGGNWLIDDIEIWVPNMLGSILFLASGVLAAREVQQATALWQPTSIEWCIASINLLGCIMFMVAAVLALETPVPLLAEASELSIMFTLLGAIGFFLGAALLLLEGVSNSHSEEIQ